MRTQQQAIQFYLDQPFDMVELAVQNNFEGVRNNLTLDHPKTIGPSSSYVEVIQLLQHLIQTDRESEFLQSFAGVQPDYNALSGEQRSAAQAFGTIAQQQKSLRNGGEGSTGNFDWGQIIEGLFDTVNTVIDEFGPNNPPPAPPGGGATGGGAQAFDWAPIITIAKYVGGGLLIGFTIWGIVSIVKVVGK